MLFTVSTAGDLARPDIDGFPSEEKLLVVFDQSPGLVQGQGSGECGAYDGILWGCGLSVVKVTLEGERVEVIDGHCG